MAAPLQQPPLEDMMRNLKVDHPADMAPLKAESPSDGISCISSLGDASSSVKGNDTDHESLLANDQSVPYPVNGYYAYSYPGFDGGVGEHGYYVSGDGSEVQYPVMQADNGSVMYFMSGIEYHQPGYYSPYQPMYTVDVDGQYFNQHVYPSTHVLQPSIISPGYLPYGDTYSSPYLWDPSCLVGDVAHGNSISKKLENSNSKPTLPKSFKSNLSNPLSNKKSSMSPLDVSSYRGTRGQLKSANKNGSTLPKFPSYKFNQSSPVNLKANARSWVVAEKPKTRNWVDSDFGLLNEQKDCPRTVDSIDTSISCGDTQSVAADVIGNSNIIGSSIRRGQYNSPDFTTKYDHALFFVIKSYSEDDVHKSIKYNVWASTPNGNKKLDNAFQDAQQKTTDKSSKCPVFLFFSVNASGQFCGVAEMIGQVDFNKSMDFWQQDKWNGYFPVKWHIIKDVPNPQLRHIILENNENKPVTNSRDTQEVKFQQGIEMLGIFKNYTSKTSVLDDFDFYESREKVMQEKRIRPALHHFVNAQAKVDKVANILPMTYPVKKRNEELAGVDEKM